MSYGSLTLLPHTWLFWRFPDVFSSITERNTYNNIVRLRLPRGLNRVFHIFFRACKYVVLIVKVLYTVETRVSPANGIRFSSARVKQSKRSLFKIGAIVGGCLGPIWSALIPSTKLYKKKLSLSQKILISALQMCLKITRAYVKSKLSWFRILRIRFSGLLLYYVEYDVLFLKKKNWLVFMYYTTWHQMLFVILRRCTIILNAILCYAFVYYGFHSVVAPQSI